MILNLRMHEGLHEPGSAATAQGTLGVSSTSLWTLCQSFEGRKLRSPSCYGCDMLLAYMARQTGRYSPGASAAAHITVIMHMRAYTRRRNLWAILSHAHSVLRKPRAANVPAA